MNLPSTERRAVEPRPRRVVLRLLIVLLPLIHPPFRLVEGRRSVHFFSLFAFLFFFFCFFCFFAFPFSFFAFAFAFLLLAPLFLFFKALEAPVARKKIKK
jgi:hypothetical protein